MGAKFWAITRDTETVNMATSVRAGTASLHTGGKIVKIKQPSATLYLSFCERIHVPLSIILIPSS